MKKLTYTILSMSLLTVMAGAAVAPALDVIREHFADVPSLTLQLIVSIPALFIIISSFFFVALSRLMRTRSIALLGLSLYVAAGAGCYFVDNIWILLAMRALLGVSVGMIMPLSTGLLAFYFPPEEQARLMGLSGAMNQMGGLVATWICGMLATVSWNAPFLVYSLAMISVAMVIVYLPNEQLRSGEITLQNSPDQIDNGEEIIDSGKVHGSPWQSLMRFHPSIVGMVLLMILFFIYPTNFAVISSHNTSLDTQQITLIMVSLDLLGFIVGMMFGWAMNSCRRIIKYLAPVGFILGYGVLSLGIDMWMLIFGSIILGIANGIGVPYLNTIASIKGGKDAATTVMPLLSSALYAGQFCSPLIINPLAENMGTLTAPYILGVAVGAVFLIQTYLTRRFHALPPAITK